MNRKLGSVKRKQNLEEAALRQEEDERQATLRREEAVRKGDEDERQAARRKEELLLQLELAKVQQQPPKKEEVKAEPQFNINSASKFVPKFKTDDLDIDSYFLAFEKTAHLLQWPKECWAVLLSTQLTGKSLEVYSALSVVQCSDYDVVEEAILSSFEQVAEVHLQKFRQTWKHNSDSYLEFGHKKELSFDKCVGQRR